jgi:hypothetical protein
VNSPHQTELFLSASGKADMTPSLGHVRFALESRPRSASLPGRQRNRLANHGALFHHSRRPGIAAHRRPILFVDRGHNDQQHNDKERQAPHDVSEVGKALGKLVLSERIIIHAETNRNEISDDS